jgi:hypothetical protein
MLCFVVRQTVKEKDNQSQYNEICIDYLSPQTQSEIKVFRYLCETKEKRGRRRGQRERGRDRDRVRDRDTETGDRERESKRERKRYGWRKREKGMEI